MSELQYQSRAAPTFVPSQVEFPAAAKRLVARDFDPFPEPAEDVSWHPFNDAQIVEADYEDPPAAPECSWFAPFCDPPDVVEGPPIAEHAPFGELRIVESLFGTIDYHPGHWYAPFAELPAEPPPEPETADFGRLVVIESLFEDNVAYELAWTGVYATPADLIEAAEPLESHTASFVAPLSFYFRLFADSLRWYLSGAGSDGGSQTDPDAALGNYRSSTEAVRVGVIDAPALRSLSVVFASGANGLAAEVGALTAIDADHARYQASGSETAGPVTEILAGETVTLEDGDDPSKWVRVTRAATGDLAGLSSLTFHIVEHNVFSAADAADAETAAGSDKYRGVFARNVALATVEDLRLYVGTLGDSAIAMGGALGSSGAGTITATTDSLAGWPHKGWARVETSAGVLREIVWYSARTDTVLTVPALGRARLGTSATAGAITDRVTPVPGIRIAWEAASPAFEGSVQTIADEDTAPTGVSWSTAITAAAGIAVGDLTTKRQGVLWIHRELPADGGNELTAYREYEHRVMAQYTVEGVQYTETLAGQYKAAIDALDRYELHVGVDAEPDWTAAPDETFTSLPHTTTLTLGTDTVNFLGVRFRSQYDQLTDVRQTTVIAIDGSGDETTPAPSAPIEISLSPAADGNFLARAAYYYELDPAAQRADTFLVYLTVDGSDPDPALDTPVEVAMELADGIAYLEYTSTGGNVDGTTGKVIVRTRRSGTPDVDSTNTDIYAATADATAPSAPPSQLFWRGKAERR